VDILRSAGHILGTADINVSEDPLRSAGHILGTADINVSVDPLRYAGHILGTADIKGSQKSVTMLQHFFYLVPICVALQNRKLLAACVRRQCASRNAAP